MLAAHRYGRVENAAGSTIVLVGPFERRAQFAGDRDGSMLMTSAASTASGPEYTHAREAANRRHRRAATSTTPPTDSRRRNSDGLRTFSRLIAVLMLGLLVNIAGCQRPLKSELPFEGTALPLAGSARKS